MQLLTNNINKVYLYPAIKLVIYVSSSHVNKYLIATRHNKKLTMVHQNFIEKFSVPFLISPFSYIQEASSPKSKINMAIHLNKSSLYLQIFASFIVNLSHVNLDL